MEQKEKLLLNSNNSIKIKKEKVLDTFQFLSSLNLEKISERKLKSHQKLIGRFIYFFHVDDGSQKWR